MRVSILMLAVAVEAQSFNCNSFGCTCQGFADYFGSEVGKSWGCALSAAQYWSTSKKCDDECKSKGTGCQSSKAHHAGCEDDCNVFGCTCQGFADHFGAADGKSFGCAPTRAQAWAIAEKCEAKSAKAHHAGCEEDCKDFGCKCQGFVDYYGAEVGKTWGCAARSAQAWSTAENCDEECKSKGTGCKPASSVYKGCATPLATAKKTVTVGGFKCDRTQSATVFYPTDTSQKYPLLSFMHGVDEGGNSVDPNYKDVLESVAGAGYVVIASHSGGSNLCYPEGKADQLRAFDYIQETAEFSQMVDWKTKKGVYGHSMGADISGENAADADAIKKYNLGAAVVMHGCAAPADNPWNAILPTFFAAGTADTICPATAMETKYSWAQGPAVLAEMKGATHFECQSRWLLSPEPAGWTGYVTHWMDCHLKGSASACAKAFDICSGRADTEKPIALCKTSEKTTDLTQITSIV